MKKIIAITVVLLTYFLSPPIFADEGLPPFDLTTISSSFNYFLKTMKAYKLGNDEAIDLAIKTMDTQGLESTSRDLSARLLALKLVNTLDRLEYIDITKLPTNYDQERWVYRQKEIKRDNQWVVAEISMTKQEGKWLFSKKTLETISLFERSVKDQAVAKGVTAYDSWKERIKRRMPDWSGERSFILLNGQWLGLFALIFIAFVVERLMRLYFATLIFNFLAKRGLSISKEVNQKFTFPLSVILFTIIWTLGVQFLELDDNVLSWFLTASRVILTFGLIMAFYQLVDFICLYLEKKAQISENKFDDILVPLIRKSAKTFVIAVGLIALGDSLDLDMKGLLAGMGIVGLGVSLAAKDTLSNLFGSFTVLMDRPFSIGDWVNIDGKVEGTVEAVGLRSCRVRTFYNSLITIPNGILTNASIDNYGMRTYRRFTTKLGIQYDTPPQKIEAFCSGIRALIDAHPHTRKDYYHVYLNGLGNSSLDILLYVFFVTPDWSEELQQRHRLLLDILRLGEKIGIEFAFPTQTIHTVPSEETKYDTPYDFILAHEQSIEQANQNAQDILANNLTRD
jgi:MscS family membrane protein